MKTSLLASMVLALFIGVPFAAFAGPAPDQDGDGQPNVIDNCSLVANYPTPSCDTQQDGFGNLCDGDFNEDLAVDGSDFGLFKTAFGAGTDPGNGTDMNCDGAVDGADFTTFKAKFGTPGAAPGPSGLSCAGPVINGCPNP